MHIYLPTFLSIPSISAGFFGSSGGLSEGIYESLNCGYGSGDDLKKVQENRIRVTESLNGRSEILTLKQVHSSKVVMAETPWQWQDAAEADAIITIRPNLAIGVLTADCVPVLITSVSGGVAAAIHAGWKGAVGGVLDNTVTKLAELGFAANNLLAVIGPAISAESYEVGDELRQNFIEHDKINGRFFTTNQNHKYQFDLKSYVKARLQQLGVMSVEDVGVDTYANNSDYFSFRRTTHQGETAYGRQVSAIMLK